MASGARLGGRRFRWFSLRLSGVVEAEAVPLSVLVVQPELCGQLDPKTFRMDTAWHLRIWAEILDHAHTLTLRREVQGREPAWVQGSGQSLVHKD